MSSVIVTSSRPNTVQARMASVTVSTSEAARANPAGGAPSTHQRHASITPVSGFRLTSVRATPDNWSVGYATGARNTPACSRNGSAAGTSWYLTATDARIAVN